jgi:hypothetical protein
MVEDKSNMRREEEGTAERVDRAGVQGKIRKTTGRI